MSLFQRIKPKTNKKAGFLLIEVVASVLIIATALVFIIRSFSTSLRVIKRSNEYFKALLLLDEVLWPFEAKGEIAISNCEGEFENDKNFNYSISATSSADETDLFRVNKVIAKIIQNQSGNKNILIEAVTYLKNEIAVP